LRDVIGREIRNVARKTGDVIRGRQVVQGDEVEEFWALRHVSFEVKQGEIVGIIGRNGAGKSTLLKILSRITEPSEGRVVLRGRVASLLEVGTGFHPELTGRENIFLNGAILGMSHAEIKRKFDEIVAFAEVDRFLDTPVKRYSSGMYVRLAFAVAAHLEPEILVIDEVLAVGDAEFQKKCLGKMGEVSRQEARTVLFVSHNQYLIQSLCQRCILLAQGQLANAGTPSEVLADYLYQSARDNTFALAAAPRHLTVSGELRITSFSVTTPTPSPNRHPFSATLEVEVDTPIRGAVFGIGFNATNGQRLLSCDSDFSSGGEFTFAHPGKYAIEIVIPSLPLTPSPYTLDVGCRTTSGRMLDEIKSFALFEVVPSETTPQNELGSFPTVCLLSSWRCPSQALELL
jgi:lipopolysaccharide transport system ATP-binding protein